MDRNTSGQKLTFFAFTPADGLPKTGDAANITIYVSKDDGTVTALTDSSATEIDATNDPGSYVVDLTQSETNGIKLRFSGKSSTSGVVVVPQTIYTTPAGHSTVTIANNAMAANMTRLGGSATPVTNMGTVFNTDFGTNYDSGNTRWAAYTTLSLQYDAVGNIPATVTGMATAAELAKVPKSDSTVGWNATARAQIQSEVADELTARGYSSARAGYLDNINNANLQTTVAQTGDTYALANGASGFVAIKGETAAILEDTGTTLPAAIADIPTVAEFEARTLVAADYGTAANQTTIAGYLDTEIAAIKAKTDNLPSDPADASDIASAFSTVNSTLSTIAGYVDTEIAAIKAKTDLIPASPAAVGSAMTVSDKTGFKLASDGLDSVLVESGITEGAGLTNDTGTQLTSINARQAFAIIASAATGVLAGASGANPTFKPAGKPSGNTRVDATVASTGRTAVNLKVPD